MYICYRITIVMFLSLCSINTVYKIVKDLDTINLYNEGNKHWINCHKAMRSNKRITGLKLKLNKWRVSRVRSPPKVGINCQDVNNFRISNSRHIKKGKEKALCFNHTCADRLIRSFCRLGELYSHHCQLSKAKLKGF